MRYTAFASVLCLAACGTDSPDSNTPAFSVQSEDITIAPSQEVTYCYYFKTPNTKPIAVNRWVSDMTPGSHHMIFFTGGLDHADGIDMNNECGVNLGNGIGGLQSWVFASQTAHSEQLLPPDDGEGKPLAQVIQPNTQAAIQMHYLNQAESPLVAHVKLEAYALPEVAEYTPTAPYITYNFDISVPPMAKGVTATASCDAPAGKFWQMSTHAHKQAVATEIKDGDAPLFNSTDWEHPGAKLWETAPFYSVQSGKVSWTCTYNNVGDNQNKTVVQGQSAADNEMCMATGYYFPATRATVCGANIMPPGSTKPIDCACIPL